MRRLLQGTLTAGLLCWTLSGCAQPNYGYYGPRGYGYAPYSYGWPIYARGYAPDFADRHPWEEHHRNEVHHETFWHGPSAGAHLGGGHPGGFGGHTGGFGGGHGGGGRR
jgi:hypothetical protein